MNEILYQREYVTIVIDPSVPAIYEEWLGSVNAEEFKTTLETKLSLFKEYQHKYNHLQWLVNLCGLKVGEDAQNWANKEFHPKLAPLGIHKIGFVVPEDTLYLLDDEQLSPHMDRQKQIELCYFDNLEEAKEWLNQMPQAKSIS